MNGPESVTKPIICNCYGSLPISSAFFFLYFFLSKYNNLVSHKLFKFMQTIFRLDWVRRPY